MVYLNQIAAYKAAGAVDIYGDVTSADPLQVPCRCEPTTKIVFTNQGAAYQTSFRYFLNAEITPAVWKDSIDDRVVASVLGLIDGSGSLVGYEVYT